MGERLIFQLNIKTEKKRSKKAYHISIHEHSCLLFFIKVGKKENWVIQTQKVCSNWWVSMETTQLFWFWNATSFYLWIEKVAQRIKSKKIAWIKIKHKTRSGSWSSELIKTRWYWLRAALFIQKRKNIK